MWFDISGVANNYGRNFRDYTKRTSFKEYLKSVLKIHSLNESELIKKSGHQIKIHNNLFVDFARWINPDFAVFADKAIMDILLGEKHLCDKKFDFLNNKLEQKESTIKQLKKDRNVYGRKRGGNMETVTFIINNTEAEISKEAFNVLLCEEGLISKDVCDCCNRHEYIAVQGNSEYQGNAILVHYDSAVSVVEKYEVKKVLDNQLMFDFEAH